MRAVRVWLIVILFLMRLAPETPAAAPDIRENLEYQISLWPWSDVTLILFT